MHLGACEMGFKNFTLLLEDHALAAKWLKILNCLIAGLIGKRRLAPDSKL